MQKIQYFLIFILFLSSSFSLKLQSKLKNKSKLQSKQLFGFVSQQIDKDLQQLVIKKKESDVEPVFIQTDNDDDDQYETGPLESSSKIKEGWLRLACVDFSDSKKFPSIPGQDGSKQSMDLIYGVKNDDPNLNNNADVIEQNAIFRSNNQYSVGSASDVPSIDSFYFRLSGLNLYYTEEKDSDVVLGAIAINNVLKVKEGQFSSQTCWEVTNIEKDLWTLCAKDNKEMQDWSCAIATKAGVPCINNDVVIEKIVKQPVIFMPIASPFCNEKWNYGAQGHDWNCKCSEAANQSPINIPACYKNIDQKVDFTFNYVEIDILDIVYEDNMLKLKCTKSDEVCRKSVFAKLIDLNASEYSSKEIRFHTPADHEINGEKFDMELQIIMDAFTDNDWKKKAVLSFLVKMEAGASNQFLDLIDPLKLPNMALTSTSFRSDNVNQDIAKISVSDLFKRYKDDTFDGSFSYYRYSGGMSSPPCEEYTDWYIVKEPIAIGFSQLEMFKRAIQKQDELIGSFGSNSITNNRATQPLNGRLVELYEDQKADSLNSKSTITNPKLVGHYEKIESKKTQYFWVPSHKPSGIEGAFVVNEKEAHGQV